MTMLEKGKSPMQCEWCGRESCGRPVKVDLEVDRGHVRRASIAANHVYAQACGPAGTENGLVFMTTILLVERLAHAFACEPEAVLHKVLHCFLLKRRLSQSMKPCN